MKTLMAYKPAVDLQTRPITTTQVIKRPSELIPIVLDLDGSLRAQPKVMTRLTDVVDLRSEEQNLRLYPSRAAIVSLRRRLREYRAFHAGPLLTFLGSGDFHYVALTLLETLPASSETFTLVLIDNHPDWFSDRPRYHCGNWVSSALKLRSLHRVIMIGQDSPDLKWFRTATAPFNALAKNRLRIYPQRVDNLLFPLRTKRLKFQTLNQLGASATFDQISRELAGKSIYLSIDKDCLCPQYAVTDWEQGQMTLDELNHGVRVLRQNCNIIGADVCGESAPSPLRGFFKRLDAGRLFCNSPRPTNGDRINAQTNLAILDAFGIDSPQPRP